VFIAWFRHGKLRVLAIGGLSDAETRRVGGSFCVRGLQRVMISI